MDVVYHAVFQEMFFANTVLPYTEKYDAYSWWFSDLIFCKKANHYYRHQMIQNNCYSIVNTQSSDYIRLPKDSWSEYLKIRDQVSIDTRAELGVDIK